VIQYATTRPRRFNKRERERERGGERERERERERVINLITIYLLNNHFDI